MNHLDGDAFRQEVREFALTRLPHTVRAKVLFGQKLEKAEYVAWQKELHEKGWIAPSWPKEHGGTGWSLDMRRAFHHEMALCCAPETVAFGLTMVGPVIYTFGNEEQKARYLPAILSSDEWWCQGFSEPGAGSDLASLQTRAEDRGDHFIVNGQKTWTTLGMFADRMFCLARTSREARKQDGISFLLLDMKAPGVEVRTIRTIDDGESICEVFFDDVAVPKRDLVGVEGRGWDYAKFLLGHERAMIARVGRSRMQLDRARRIADAASPAGSNLRDDPHIRARLCEIEARLRALEVSELRALDEYRAGRGFGARTSSMLKVEGSEICQSLTELLVDLVGRHATVYAGRSSHAALLPPYAHGVMGDHLFNRVATIYGGSSEVQRNVIAKTLF